MTAILHVISGLGMGGAERNLVEIVGAMQARAMPQHVACVDDRGFLADEIEAHGSPVTALGIGSLAAVPAGVFRLARLIERTKANIVQGWMPHGNFMAALAHRWARGRAERRLIWSLRASNVEERPHRAMLWLTARLSRWPDVIIANSQAGARFHAEHGYRPRRLEVIPNGIDTQRFRPDPGARAALRSELGILGDEVVAIHVARVNSMKDHATLLAVIAKTPQIQWLLVGTGTGALSLPANARALGIRRDVERLYACADMVVSTSAFAEGFSNVIAEGMSTGLIPIATDVGDARLIVGDTGKILAPRDADRLARALAAEAARPREERVAQGLKARARIVDRFALPLALDAFARLYETLAQEKSAA